MKLLGMTEEEQLEFEQATGMKPEDLVKESVGQTETILSRAIKEIQEVVGPHGAVTRLQAGGVRIARGTGIGVFADGVQKTMIDPQGNLFVGSDVGLPETTTFSVFVNDQIYNNEEMGAGDLLIGDNSTGNVKYDASEGQLQFRNGTTVRAYVDTDGTIKAGGGDVTADNNGIWITNQQAAFGFEDTGGDRFKLYLQSSSTDDLDLINATGVGKIAMRVDTSTHAVLDLFFGEDSSEAEAALLAINPPSGIAIFQLSSGVEVWSGKDGAVTVFNEDSFDIDHRFEGATDASLLFLDAGNDRVGVGVGAPGSKLDVAGSFQCDSITNDTGLAAGTYTPTITNVANITSSSVANPFMYTRVGNVVTGSGRIIAAHDGSGDGQIRFTLPIASDLADTDDLQGNATNPAAVLSCSVIPDTTNNEAILFINQGVGTGSIGWRIVFQYVIV